MGKIESLKPTLVWQYFSDILAVPRPSKREGKIIEYILSFASKHGFDAVQDEAGNVLVRKPATKGMEGCPSVVLQSHLDMVCEKDGDVEHDFGNDPIKAYIDGDWVKAQGTTLGADDGIGIAAQLAILASKGLKHGPIECLFTVDEESGLTGAQDLDPALLSSNILINLDSEDEGELFIGCAGGVETEATFYYEKENVPSDSVAFTLSVSGLNGGHSGDDIDKGLGNSLKIINRFLWKGTNMFDLRLHRLDAGNLHNAIPREAYATFTIHKEDVSPMQSLFTEMQEAIMMELQGTEPNLSINLNPSDLPGWVIDEPTHFDLLNALYACPHGVLAMSHSMPGLVETSTNLASIRFIQDNMILVTTSQRSSIDSSRTDAASMVESVFRMANSSVVHSGGYPGWKPNTDSQILKITEGSYRKLFGQEPIVRAIHAGLECGLFLEKKPGLDMISFGPTIKGVHSPSERLSIETVEKFWLLLVDVLENIPTQ